MKLTKIRAGLYEATIADTRYTVEELHNGTRWVWRIVDESNFFDGWVDDVDTLREARANLDLIAADVAAKADAAAEAERVANLTPNLPGNLRTADVLAGAKVTGVGSIKGGVHTYEEIAEQAETAAANRRPKHLSARRPDLAAADEAYDTMMARSAAEEASKNARMDAWVRSQGIDPGEGTEAPVPASWLCRTPNCAAARPAWRGAEQCARHAMHYVVPEPGGARCSCGKSFHYSTGYGMDAQRCVNMAHGNARRHADAANKKRGNA